MKRWTVPLVALAAVAVFAIVRRPSPPEVVPSSTLVREAPLKPEPTTAAAVPLQPIRPPSTEQAQTPAPPENPFAEELKRLRTGPLSTAKVKAIKRKVAEWARVEPAAAAGWTATIAEGWTWTDPDGSMTSEAIQATIRQEIAEIWATADPVSASVWAGALPAKESGVYSPSVVGIVGGCWARQNPEAAATWARSLPAEQARGTALEGVYEAWVRRDAREAAAWIAGRPVDESLRSERAIFVDVWTRRSPGDAASWVMSLSPEDRDPLMRPLVSLWTILSPREAARWLATDSGVDVPEGTYGDAAYQLGRKDPEAAIAWASALPEGPRRTAALLATADTWGPRDAEAAAAFFSGLPNDMTRNGPMAKVGAELLQQDPSGAEFRRLGLPTGPFDYDAQESLKRIFERWSAVDALAASAWAAEAAKSRGGRELKRLLKARK